MVEINVIWFPIGILIALLVGVIVGFVWQSRLLPKQIRQIIFEDDDEGVAQRASDKRAKRNVRIPG